MLNGEEIVAKELTVRQVEELLDGAAEDQKISTVDLLVESPVNVEFVIQSTGLSSEYLNGEILPSDARQIWEAVEEANPFLVSFLKRAQKVILQQAEQKP